MCKTAKVTDRTVYLYHVTPTRNQTSILNVGISPHRAQGKMKVVWLVTVSQLEWAITHVAKEHHVSEHMVSVIAVRVRRSEIYRFRRGRWYTYNTITHDKFEAFKGVLWFRKIRAEILKKGPSAIGGRRAKVYSIGRATVEHS